MSGPSPRPQHDLSSDRSGPAGRRRAPARLGRRPRPYGGAARRRPRLRTAGHRGARRAPEGRLRRAHPRRTRAAQPRPARARARREPRLTGRRRPRPGPVRQGAAGRSVAVPPHAVVRAHFGAHHHRPAAGRLHPPRDDDRRQFLLPQDDDPRPRQRGVPDTGSALFGKRSPVGRRVADAGSGPVMHVTGRSVLGHVQVSRGFKWPWHEQR